MNLIEDTDPPLIDDLQSDRIESAIKNAEKIIATSWSVDSDCIPCFTGSSRDLSDHHPVHPELFTSAIVADLLIGRSEYRDLTSKILNMLDREMRPDGLFHFFKEHERLPADADCTAIAHSVLLHSGRRPDRAHHALDQIIANSNADGIVETYFDPTGERSGIVDPVVCCNVLNLAHLLGRTDELCPTLEYVYRIFINRDYLQGTRYYHSPDSLLYFASRSIPVRKKLLKLLISAVHERQGATEFPIDIAQRIIASHWLQIDDHGESLKILRYANDIWPADSLFQYGRRRIYFGSQVLTAAFTAAALNRFLVFNHYFLPPMSNKPIAAAPISIGAADDFFFE